LLHAPPEAQPKLMRELLEALDEKLEIKRRSDGKKEKNGHFFG